MIFDSLRKKRLVRQGYACEKTRKTAGEDSWRRSLDASVEARWLLFLLFAAGLATLIFWGPQPAQAQRCLLALLILATAAAQIWINHPNTYASNSRLSLMLGVELAHLVVVKMLLGLAEARVIAPEYAALCLPYAFAPLMLSALLGRHHGLHAAVFCSLWSSILFRSVDAISLVLSLISGFTAVFVTRQVRQRARLLRAGVFVGLAVWLLALCFQLVEIYWSAFAQTPWRTVGWQTLAVFGVAIGTAVVAGGLLPALERVFGVTTAISWREMGDLNHPLLKRLAQEAPGTFFHSLNVGQLASEAAQEVGANPDLCQTCALFHDVGKLVKPEYFAENMPEGGSPHDTLAPSMSALIIVAHVKEGVNLALENHLNRQIIDVIQSHHGTSLVWWFWKKALAQQEEARAQGKLASLRPDDVPGVDESVFRYSGPLPRTKEEGIISLADSVESASRSLEKPTPQRIEEMIGKIVASRIDDGQLDDCDLTFRELTAVAESFASTLQNMLHRRLAYPKDERSDDDSRKAGDTTAGGGQRPSGERPTRRTTANVLPPAAARSSLGAARG